MSISDVFKDVASKAIETTQRVAPPMIDREKIMPKPKVSRVRIKLSDGRFARAKINGSPEDADFGDKVDAAKLDIENHLGLNKPAPAKQPIRGGSEAILGGTIFDPSRKPQTPQQPARKPTALEEREQATRNVLKTKSGPEFRKAVAAQEQAGYRGAMADAGMRPSREGDPSLVGDEGLAPKRKKMGIGDPYQRLQRIAGTAIRAAGSAISPAFQFDNPQDKKAVDQALGAAAQVPGSPEDVLLNLGLAGLGAAGLKLVQAAFKVRPNGSMRDIAEMIFSQEGRAAIKQADPQIAAVVDVAPDLVRAKFTPTPEAAYTPGETPDLLGMARSRQPQSNPVDDLARIASGEPVAAPAAVASPVGTLARVASDEPILALPARSQFSQEVDQLRRVAEQPPVAPASNPIDDLARIANDQPLPAQPRPEPYRPTTPADEKWNRALDVAVEDYHWDISKVRLEDERLLRAIANREGFDLPPLDSEDLLYVWDDFKQAAQRSVFESKPDPARFAPEAVEALRKVGAMKGREGYTEVKRNAQRLWRPVKGGRLSFIDLEDIPFEFRQEILQESERILSGRHFMPSDQIPAFLKRGGGNKETVPVYYGDELLYKEARGVGSRVDEEIADAASKTPVPLQAVRSVLSKYRGIARETKDVAKAEATANRGDLLKAIEHYNPRNQTNAVQIQETSQSVLRQERPQVGLQEVGKGNAEPQVPAKQGQAQAQEVTPPEGTSIKNVATNRDRVAMDLSELPEPERKTFVSMIDEARAKGDSDPARVLDRARKINADAKPTPLSDVESAGFTDVLNGLKNDYDATIKKIQNTSDPAELAKLSDDIDRIRNDFDEITLATKRSGTETARALVARKITIDRDYSPLSLRAEAKAIVAKAGAELSPEQAKRIDELATKIKELEDRVAKTEAENVTLKQQAEEAFSLTLREPKGRSTRQSPAARAKTRQEAFNVFREANKKLLNAPLGSGGNAAFAYAEYIKEIAPAVVTLVKTYIDEGIDVLDTVVRKVLDDFNKEGLPIKEDDILEIIAGKHTEQKPLAERTKTILRFRAEAKKIVDADVIKARKAEIEAKKIANAEARKKAQLEARKKTEAVRAVQRAEMQAWRNQERAIKRAEMERIRNAIREGRQITSKERADYVRWWRTELRNISEAERAEFRAWQKEQRAQDRLNKQVGREYDKARRQQENADASDYIDWWKQKLDEQGVKTDREEYIAWWNDTAPAEAESLMRKIERQVERQAVTEAPLPKAKAKQFKENEALRIELEAERVKADRYLQELREEAERSKVPKALQVIGDALRIDPQGLNKVRQAAGDFANPRNIKASFDLSAPFNQGLFTLFTNPKAWANSTVAMFRALGKGGLVNEVARIRTSPYYKKAMAGKLAISETGGIGPNEQRLGKTVFDKLPGFSKSNDAYAAFTQTARMRMFESLAKKLEAPRVNWIETAKTGKIVKTEGGTLSLDEYKELAEYVNTVTGAGRGKIANALNKARFFAGGYTVSRFQTALGQPIIKAAIKKNPALAREVVKDYAKFVTAASSGYALLTAMGYEVDSDIRSSTFMQVKLNGRWIDPFGGIFKPLILISRMTLGSKKEGEKRVTAAQPESTFGYFVAGKQEPISRTGLSIIKGQSFGKNTSIGSAEGIKNLAMGLYAPIFVEQAIETFNDKTLTPEQQTALSIAQLFGVQMNRDEKKKIDKRVAKPLADVVAPMATKIGEAKSNVNERLKGLVAPRK